MLNATHGPWCGAVTWKTKCPRPGCRADVYFFRCNCGSKVFFDSLGAPWPIHDCDLSWGQGLDRQRNESGGATVQIAPGVTAYRSGSISPDVVTRTKRRDSTRISQRKVRDGRLMDGSGRTFAPFGREMGNHVSRTGRVAFCRRSRQRRSNTPLRYRRARLSAVRGAPRADRDRGGFGGDRADPARSGVAGDDPRALSRSGAPVGPGVVNRPVACGANGHHAPCPSRSLPVWRGTSQPAGSAPRAQGQPAL